MQVTIRITRRRFIVGGIVAVSLVGVVLFRLASPGPNTVIARRNSIRGRLAIPKDLREFPVEQYADRRDWFGYRSGTDPARSCRWQLYIICSAEDAEKWCRAFHRYFQTRGKCIERGGDITLPGQNRIFQLRQNSGGSAYVLLRNRSGQLQILFEYRKTRMSNRIWRTKFGRYLAKVLLEVGVPIDAITRES
jgi:hypothetical protein